MICTIFKFACIYKFAQYLVLIYLIGNLISGMFIRFYFKCFSILFLFFKLFLGTNSQLCMSREYFDGVSLRCMQCPDNETMTTALSDTMFSPDACYCLPGYFRNETNSTCEPCPPLHGTSFDGTICMRCQSDTFYDSKHQACKHCSKNSVLIDRHINGSRLSFFTCIECSTDTIADQIANECIRCHTSFYQEDGSCSCPKSSHSVLDGQCLKQSELSSIPDRESSYIVHFAKSRIKSEFFFNHYRSVAHSCTFSYNTTACQILANMCVLLHYNYDNELSICGYYKTMYGKLTEDIPSHVPVIYYNEGESTKILMSDKIENVYSFKLKSPANKLNITVSKYSVNGKLISFGYLDKTLDICPSIRSALGKVMQFGSVIETSCSIDASSLTMDYDTIFYEMFLNYFDSKIKRFVNYPLPVLNKDIKKEKVHINKLSRSKWQLTRRFFLFDNLAGKEHNPSKRSDSFFSVRYVKKIEFIVRKRLGDEDGFIYPPLVVLSYGEMSSQSQLNSISIELKVKYSMDFRTSKQNISISVGVMSVFAVLWSLLETYKWGKRCGKVGVDMSGIVRLLLILCGNMANIMFLVMFCTCLYWTLIFKRQDVAFLFLPTTDEEYLIKQYLISSFSLKSIHLFYVLYEQMTIDLFLVDWEKPRARNTIPHPKLQKSKGDDIKAEQPVSIWRLYFIANEWNEIQTLRKINLAYQLIAMLFFLKVVDLEKYATYDVNCCNGSPASYVCRFAISIFLYLSLVGVQLVFRLFIYERYIEYRLQQFIDLCSMSNISVFILQQPLYGYYIHGRSVHGFADSDLRTFYEQLKREEEDLCAHRGLEPSSDCQTFQVISCYNFRDEYKRILHSTQQELMKMARYPSNKSKIDSLKVEKTVQAHEAMKNFFEIFLQHSSKDIDYVIKDKFFLESILDIEFQDIDDKCLFFRDQNHTFDRVLFYGQETLLIVFEMLLFTFIDLFFYDFVLASVVTYFVCSCIKIMRNAGGKRNLTKKTLVDPRFLM